MHDLFPSFGNGTALRITELSTRMDVPISLEEDSFELSAPSVTRLPQITASTRPPLQIMAPTRPIQIPTREQNDESSSSDDSSSSDGEDCISDDEDDSSDESESDEENEEPADWVIEEKALRK